MKKRILLMPSWYPAPGDPHIGVYFREQALLMQDHGVDYRLVVVRSKAGSIWGQLKWMLGAWLWPARAIAPLETEEPLDGVVIHEQAPNWLPDQWKIKLLGRYHRQAYQMLALKGWLPELIHAQSAIDAGIYAHLLSWVFKVPFAIIEHQTLHLYYLSETKRRYIYSAWQRASKLAVVSEYQKRALLMHQPNCHPVTIPNWIDENFFKPLDMAPTTSIPFHIVNIAYPSPLKDNETFFKALGILREMNASFRYTVVGAKVFSTLTPPEQAVLPSLAKKYQLEGMGECLPFAGREEIRRILQSADVYVCTSLSETFGIAPREAMMCGVPVISTACGGVEEAITRNTGWQVATRNAGAIAEALLAMIKRELYFDPALVRKGITEQCGSEKFSYLMQEFYGLHTNQVA